MHPQLTWCLKEAFLLLLPASLHVDSRTPRSACSKLLRALSSAPHARRSNAVDVQQLLLLLLPLSLPQRQRTLLLLLCFVWAAIGWFPIS
jgi:hypothetical protein